MFPLQFEERTEIARIENFDPQKLPLFARIEIVEERTQRLNPTTLEMQETVERKEYMVQPLGYMAYVGAKLFETLEIALWGTILAAFISAPLAFYGARNYAPNRVLYFASRAIVSFFRAVPELISALFLVLAYGFGPIAGVLALALHSGGFLGKFFAEDIENADDKPQEGLRAIGANKVKVFLYGVWPQVAPQYIAYAFYIFDRNMRMATVIGIVGAGGIGQELKGRYDLYNYHHVGTILLAIFLAVFVLDQISARVRSRYF
jgi:phosphonate transport system permease protein